MRKFSYLILFSVLMSISVYADFKRISLNKDQDGPITHWVIFVTRNSGDTIKKPGHAFVVWGKRDMYYKKWISLEGYGLYPKTTENILFGTVPGKIVKESVEKVRTEEYSGLAVNVTEQMYNYSKMNIKAIKTDSNTEYNLYNKNCIHFITLVLKSLSLNIPKKIDEVLPSDFMKTLLKIN